ncbi:hypothetical protein K431DRAFT_111015 [Polychaeton citri CBS 116435]|uniref:Uncharacterized protein n=1 Tax=Polychaeton citri CBS 116435 TaxID=1314669 RepID=A0A9P4UMF7_9PEZI|nr:hypothetical protein K431DRAFT_111015 [Polychaeton citri CBS 116435]
MQRGSARRPPRLRSLLQTGGRPRIRVISIIDGAASAKGLQSRAYQIRPRLPKWPDTAQHFRVMLLGGRMPVSSPVSALIDVTLTPKRNRRDATPGGHADVGASIPMSCINFVQCASACLHSPDLLIHIQCVLLEAFAAMLARKSCMIPRRLTGHATMSLSVVTHRKGPCDICCC